MEQEQEQEKEQEQEQEQKQEQEQEQEQEHQQMIKAALVDSSVAYHKCWHREQQPIEQHILAET
jgi:hypothetical protein